MIVMIAVALAGGGADSTFFSGSGAGGVAPCAPVGCCQCFGVAAGAAHFFS